MIRGGSRMPKGPLVPFAVGPKKSMRRANWLTLIVRKRCTLSCKGDFDWTIDSTIPCRDLEIPNLHIESHVLYAPQLAALKPPAVCGSIHKQLAEGFDPL